MGEYERGSTAVVNAYIAPRSSSLPGARSTRRLPQLGLRALACCLCRTTAARVSVEQVARAAGHAGAVGPGRGRRCAQGLCGAGAERRQPDLHGDRRHELRRDGDGQGRRAGSPTSSIIDGYHLPRRRRHPHASAPGGGDHRRVDDAGLLFVGPRGAGARPRPGELRPGRRPTPTVTDAQLVLGRLRPGPLAGGASRSMAGSPSDAIEQRLARPLGLSVDEAAAGIIRLLEQHLLQAVQRLSIERGHDPTALHAGRGGRRRADARLVHRPQARLPAVYCCRALAGAFCALGMLQCADQHEYSRVVLGKLGPHTDRRACARRWNGWSRPPRRSLRWTVSPPTRRRSCASWSCATRASIGAIRIPAARAGAPLGRGRCGGVPGRAPAPLRPHRSRRDDRDRGPVRGRHRPSRRACGSAPFRPGAARPSRPTGASSTSRRARAKFPPTSIAGPTSRPATRFAGLPSSRKRTTSVVVGPGDVCRSIRSATLSSGSKERCPLKRDRPTSAATRLDPVTLALVQNRLDHISEQMG